MKTLNSKDKQSNLQELTKNEALLINGGNGSGSFWEEVGQFGANIAETVKDIGDDEKWFG